jgi:opacity protein-like surface antigen
MERYRIAWLVMSVVLCVPLWAQTEQPPIAGAGRDTFDERLEIERLRAKPLNWFGSFYFGYSQPRGDFKRFLDSINNKWGLGFGFNGGYTFSEVPLSVGAALDVLFYGSQERTFETQLSIGGIPRMVYDTVSTSITFVPITVFVRIAPTIEWFQPYVEAGAGLTVISSSFSLQSNVGGSQNQSRSHVPFQYSVGAGLNVKVADVFNIPVSRQAYYVHLGLRYVYGDFSDYTFWRFASDNSRSLEVVRGASRTDLYVISLGISAAF